MQSTRSTRPLGSSPMSFFQESLACALSLYAWPWYRVRHAVLSRFGTAAGAHADGKTEMSLNDPQWGKRGNNNNDGPPDLDQIVRKFNQKLAGLFGGKSDGGGSGGGGAPSGAVMSGGFGIAVMLAAMVWLATGFYIVDEGSQGVELRLGKYQRTTSSGPQWHWPYPVESVIVVNVSQVRALEVGHRNNQKTKMKDEALMLTEDQNIVDVQFAVQYTLSDAMKYVVNNNKPDEAVRQVAETAMREIVGRSKMDYVLYEGRGDIATRAKTLMQTILDRYQTGILISAVNLQNAQPPQEVQGSFEDAVRAKQDRDRLKNEGEAYANDILPKAKGFAARLLEEANGHKQNVIARAQGDAARFSSVVAEYEKAPQVTRERIYLETIQQVMQNTSKVLVDQKGGQNLLYLPLDKLIQMSGQSPVPVAEPARSVTVTESTPATTPADPNPPRRDLRARENR